MSDNEFTVPEATDAVVAYSPSFVSGNAFDVPPAAISITQYPPQFEGVSANRFDVPQAVLNVRTYAPLFYSEEPVTEGDLALWIYLNGVDVTQYLGGEVRVKEAESSSAIASFNLTFGPTIKNGQDAWIVVYDGSELKALFIGELYLVKPSPDEGIIECKASNNLQNAVRELSDDELLQLTGGYYHKEISRTEGDQWEKSLELLETVPREIHVDHSGHLVVTDWKAKEVADVEITNANRYAGTLRGEVAQGSDIVNRNRVTVQHVYKRRKLRTLNCGWSCPDGFNEWYAHKWTLPNQDAVIAALDSCGWEYRGVGFTPPWHHRYHDGKYIYIDPVRLIISSFDDDLIIGFSTTLSTTWDQTMVDNHVFDIKSNTSIAAIGEHGVEEHWTISEEYESNVREEAGKDGPGAILATGSQPPGTVVANTSLGGNGELFLEYGNTLSNSDRYYDDISAETDFQGAAKTAVNRGITEMLALHRKHSEYFEVPFSHQNKLSNTTRLICAITCKGKNRSLEHRINPAGGYAYTVLEVAISGLEAQGNEPAQPLEPIESPTNDPLEDVSNIGLQTHIGGDYSTPPKPSGDISAVFSDYHQTGDMPENPSDDPVTYGRSVQIRTPEFSDADVDDREQTITQEIVVDIPIDEYVINYAGDCA